mmetsp:Transcript_5944/g.17194  ORF Transcript_5944/g.17194 Transcript_5944/m.17194 type:complete len:334 (-) Transcript_5944:31-1032(-)
MKHLATSSSVKVLRFSMGNQWFRHPRPYYLCTLESSRKSFSSCCQSLLSCIQKPVLASTGSQRYFSSSPEQPDDTDFTKLRRLEDANPERIHGIQVNPDGIGSTVLPGNLVYKFYKWTGNTRKVPLELVHGYFWMVNDLKKTGGKPTLPNKFLIPEDEAQAFPMLTGLESLSRVKADLPYFFIADKDVKCTLVNISFRDSGYKAISSWTEPFDGAFQGNSSVNSVKVSITERWSLYFLRGTLANVMRKNTPPREHDKTLLYFGSDVDDFRDVLRMHNIMANFVFLLDNKGRIRFASSGEATPEELDRVIGFAKELLSVGGNARRKGRSKTKQR